MKLKVLVVSALMVVSAGFSAVAKEEEPRNVRVAVVPVKGSEVFKVIYKSNVVSKIRLNIYNSSSQLVFSDVVTGTDGFIRPLNFRGLNAGEYRFEFFDGITKKIEKVNYNPNPAVSKKVVHVTKVNENEGKFLVAIADANNENITVRIYDRFNTLIYTETKAVSGKFAQIYRVKESTGVTIEVTDAAGVAKVSRF